MRYRELAPPAQLRPFVECLWALDDPAAEAAPRRVVPDGCVELVIHRGAPPRAAMAGEPPRAQAPAVVVGQLSGPLSLLPSGPMASLGVRFRPGGAAPLLTLPLAALRDQATPLDELDAAIAQRASDLPADEDAALAALGDLLSARLAGVVPGGLASAVRYALARRGDVRIDQLAAWCGLSTRQLERQFLATIGTEPKTFCRILRLQTVLRRARRRPGATWAEHATSCGYADQSHLNRDFLELTGTSPRRFVEEEDALSRCFTDPRRLDALLAAR